MSIHLIFLNFLILFLFTQIFYKKILKQTLIVILKVVEKFLIFNTFIFSSCLTTRKKYLKEKHRTTKEKLARAKTWA